MKTLKANGLGRPAMAILLAAGLVLSGCGNNSSETELPKLWGSFLKDIGSGALKKISGKGKPAGPSAPADPNAVVTAALAATTGPIALVVNEKSKAVSAMTPVETNGDYVTWQAATGQGMVLRSGILTSTRGLGEDLMASKPGQAFAAIPAAKEASYERRYYHLNGLGQTSELRVTCTLAPVQDDAVAIGEINEAATVMSETCRHTESSLKIQNIYWVGKSGRVLKSRQWVNGPVGYLLVQPLR